jgi:hypothetical protein
MNIRPYLSAAIVFLSLLVVDQRLAARDGDLTLGNGTVRLTVRTGGDSLISDRLELTGPGTSVSGSRPGAAVETDADFGLDVMVTDWQAPGKANNADNPVFLTKKDFRLLSHEERHTAGGADEMDLRFRAKDLTIELVMTYRLEPGAFYARRRIAVSDTAFGCHFLRWMWGRHGSVTGVRSVVKAGDFGQPVAVLTRDGGAFFGLEYPTAENHLDASPGGAHVLRCGQEMGMKIAGEPVAGEWVVTGVTPDAYVKKWFFSYLDGVRVAPLRPYTLYNSWYDLRSPEYPKVPPEHWMGEASALKMARLLRENMIEKHGIALDAFVLDDGWDVYESDWALREKEWPRGLKPLADELRKTNTTLGIWMGPTGGYSFRTRRLRWMQEHGYEVVGKTRDNMMLCLAGTKYSALFRKRVTDFVANEGVGYFKWDGIQFSCSEPGHGHAVGIYSRRAVMESLIDKCRAVREKNPSTFLNITSGTWLSPWWVKYANTIWMQGADYGYSDVPSISRRDAAITYRDFILYDDFSNLDLWFPISGLMTHGIIKGQLQLLGSANEPLDKFTDDVLLYFARGISMYELYVSPDILSEGEWNSISASITWAKDRFGVLRNTFMVGGNPMKRETYGYVHYAGSKGVVAARNPFIERGSLEVKLDPAQGMDPSASGLVVEKVYPYRMILPRLYRAGDRIDIPLEGYETALYEIYPAAEAASPLPAGVVFDARRTADGTYSIEYLPGEGGARFLDGASIVSSSTRGKTAKGPPALARGSAAAPVVRSAVDPDRTDRSVCTVRFEFAPGVHDATLALLLTPDDSLADRPKPVVTVDYGGTPGLVRPEEQEGKSRWYLVELPAGVNAVTVAVKPGKGERVWKGKAYVWMIADQDRPTENVSVTLQKPLSGRPMPPLVRGVGTVRTNVKLGVATVETISE